MRVGSTKGSRTGRHTVRGVLDQGYWSDGLLTAPSDDALVYDVGAMKSAGFSSLRTYQDWRALVLPQRSYWRAGLAGLCFGR